MVWSLAARTFTNVIDVHFGSTNKVVFFVVAMVKFDEVSARDQRCKLLLGGGGVAGLLGSITNLIVVEVDVLDTSLG